MLTSVTRDSLLTLPKSSTLTSGRAIHIDPSLQFSGPLHSSLPHLCQVCVKDSFPWGLSLTYSILPICLQPPALQILFPSILHGQIQLRWKGDTAPDNLTTNPYSAKSLAFSFKNLNPPAAEAHSCSLLGICVTNPHSLLLQPLCPVFLTGWQ